MSNALCLTFYILHLTPNANHQTPNVSRLTPATARVLSCGNHAFGKREKLLFGGDLIFIDLPNELR